MLGCCEQSILLIVVLLSSFQWFSRMLFELSPLSVKYNFVTCDIKIVLAYGKWLMQQSYSGKWFKWCKMSVTAAIVWKLRHLTQIRLKIRCFIFTSTVGIILFIFICRLLFIYKYSILYIYINIYKCTHMHISLLEYQISVAKVYGVACGWGNSKNSNG
jgi:hypothetical protein